MLRQCDERIKRGVPYIFITEDHIQRGFLCWCGAVLKVSVEHDVSTNSAGARIYDPPAHERGTGKLGEFDRLLRGGKGRGP